MNHPFKPLKARNRATFAAGTVTEPRFGSIDAEAEVLHDVQITLEGEARGHGIWLDREFCEAVAEQGNATGEAGVKVRFGHPSMCSDALGTYLGRAKNFRVVEVTRKESGEKAAGVIADIHIAPESHSAPSGDLGKWILEAAASSPDNFGQSIVFTYSDWIVKDADGNRHSYREECCGEDESKNKSFKQWKAQSADDKLYAVLGKLHGTDFTDTPAATDGVFSAGDLAAEAEEMLDEHPQILETLEKHPDSVIQFLERTGLDKKIESARLSGLQAAKDKEIAELKALDAEKDKEIAALKADVEKKDAALEDMQKSAVKQLADCENDFKAKLDEADKALAASKEEASSLKAKLDEAEKALAASKEEASSLKADHEKALAEWTSEKTSLGEQLSNCRKAAAARGEAVNQPPSEVFSDFASAVKQLGYTEAARKFPALLNAYNKAHSKGK